MMMMNSPDNGIYCYAELADHKSNGLTVMQPSHHGQ